MSNLATYINYIAKSLENRSSVHAIYFDLSKAFDTVDHKILLDKLSNLDIPLYLLKIICSYLCNRSQYVSFKNHDSFRFPVLSGVPQGSHLGPLLFLLFINDLPNYIKHCNILLYADDAKIYRSIKSTSDVDLIQADINNLIRWTTVNKLKINITKCQFMIFGKLGPNICYKVQEHVLLPLEFVTDLGVTIDRELKFNHHVASIVSRANKSLGMILRVSKHFKDPSTYFLLYNAYVRSILEYACIIWHSDRYSTHNKVLERVQKSSCAMFILEFTVSTPTIKPVQCERVTC